MRFTRFLFAENKQISVVCFGSGGSLSACHYIVPLISSTMVCWTAAALIKNLFRDTVMFRICVFLESDLGTALNEASKVGVESCSYEGARGIM